MEKPRISFKVYLDPIKHYRAEGSIYSREGKLIDELPYYLQIESNPEAVGEFYLIQYDKLENEFADTLHDSIAEAMDQAQFEYNIQNKEWVEMSPLNDNV